MAVSQCFCKEQGAIRKFKVHVVSFYLWKRRASLPQDPTGGRATEDRVSSFLGTPTPSGIL